MKRIAALFISLSLMAARKGGERCQADSIMDRIMHNSYFISTTENNLRKLYDSQKTRKFMESLNS